MLATLGHALDLLLRLKLEVELGQRVVGKNAAEANVEGGRFALRFPRSRTLILRVFRATR